MNRIKSLFSSKPDQILSVFFTAGYPRLGDTEIIAKALEEAGVDLIEVGIPFSDPIADGPVIQESNKVALDNGMNLGLLLLQVKEIRKSVNLPIILMGYINPVLQYGFKRFCEDAANAGADGFILPDLPVDIYLNEFKNDVSRTGLVNIFLVSPTTSEERIRKIDSASDAFIYAVSASSTTGVKKDFSKEQIQYFEKLRSLKLNNPFLIGFGISNHITFSSACTYGNGAIIGSAFISMLKNADDLSVEIKKFVRSILEKT